tara:strand:+ start:59 stop:607 length:549 start_codon:yes stop_codon:yes gene_type:complete
MNYNNYYQNYISEIYNLLKNTDAELIQQSVDMIKRIKEKNNTIFIAGNGGSSSIASHVSVDFTKVAKIKSLTFNNSNLITCFANDYGHESWIVESIKSYCSKNDLLILLSSSGKSPNIINAAKYCKDGNINLITMSGFDKNNELFKLGNVNFHVDSDNYNYIEMTHHIILVSIVDIFAKNIL